MEQHYCKEHGEEFFMRGRMKNYAHPIGESGLWCNEPPSGGDPMPAKVRPDSNKFKADPAKTDSIQKQVALKASVQMAISGTIDRMEVTNWASFFAHWLESGESDSTLLGRADDSPARPASPLGKIAQQCDDIGWTQRGVARWLHEKFSIPMDADVLVMLGSMSEGQLAIFEEELETRKTK